MLLMKVKIKIIAFNHPFTIIAKWPYAKAKETRGDFKLLWLEELFASRLDTSRTESKNLFILAWMLDGNTPN